MRQRLVLLAISLATLVLPAFGLRQVVAQNQRERKIDIRVSEKIPVKLTIPDDAINAFKLSDNREWPKSFKVAVTNTGTKPIYFLRLKLITDVREVQSLSFVMDFGRSELVLPRHRATETDPSIKPEETKIFVLLADQLKEWIENVKRQSHADAGRTWLVIDVINFGDGTGFVSNVPFQMVQPTN